MAAGIPASSRFLVKAAECTKHGNTSQLLPENVGWWNLYCDISPYRKSQTDENGKETFAIMDVQTLEILCKHRDIDFNEAFSKLTLINQAYYG